MRNFRRTMLAALIALTPSLAHAATEPPTPLFASDELIHLTIKAPFAKIAANRSPTAPPTDAAIAVVGASPETLPITLTVRGITRRTAEVCQFPPLRVEFAAKPGDGSLFARQKKLKLVTHCRASAAFQQYLLLEYAAYRMADLLSPDSFRVRLASIDYVDPSGHPLTSRLGFFVEDARDVARRSGLREIKLGDRVPVAALDAPASARFAMFQYLIGNLDWAMNAGPKGSACCHNARLIGAQGATTGLIPVPYDFDFAGMVDAPYASPPQGIDLPNVRVRRYRGFCRDNDDAQAVAADMLAKRAALLGVLDQIPQLDAGARRKAAAYLGGFFDQAGSPEDVSAKILKTCLN